jgi:putative redox protein
VATHQVVNASVQWTDAMRFVGSATSGHALVIDADRQRNSAPGPMELVLIALCACTATDVVEILRKKREPFASVEVRAEGVRAASSPTVYETIHIVYRVRGKVAPKAVADAVRLSEEKYCSVSAMLQRTANVTTAIEQDEHPTHKIE